MVDDFSRKILGITLLILIVGVFYFNIKITPEKAYQELDNYLYQIYKYILEIIPSLKIIA